MRRLLAAVMIAGVAGGAWALRSEPAPLDLGSLPEPAPTRAAACVAQVDRTTTGSLDLASSLAAPVGVDILTGGRVEHAEAEIDGAGGARLPLDDVIAGGLAGVLLEFPTSEAGGSVVQVGGGVSASPCTPPATGTLVIPGLSTRSLEQLQVRLVNPYAVDAVVSIASASEAGIDSAGELAGLVVPSESVVTRDIAAILPLRDSLSFFVRVQSGAVHAFAMQSGQGDRMSVEGVEAEPEWLIPVPDAARDGTLTVANPAPAPIDFEIDVYGLEGVTPAVHAGSVAAESQVAIPLRELGEGVTGVRVLGSGSVAVSLVARNDGLRAGTPGVPRLSTSWLLPGVTAATSGAAWVLNPSDVPAELSVQPLAPRRPSSQITVDPGQARSVLVDDVGSGYAIRSSTPVAIVYSVAGEAGIGLAAGAPLVEFDG